METLWKNEGAMGRKRFDHFKPRSGLNKPNLFATGCHRLPPKSHGKEGVGGVESAREGGTLRCAKPRAHHGRVAQPRALGLIRVQGRGHPLAMDAAKRQGLEKKRLSLHLAASDMDQAAAAAEALAAETQDVNLMRALETAIAACYGRPFTEGTMIQRLDTGKWVPAGADRELHERLMTLRHKTYAHTDIGSGRSAGSSQISTSDGIAHTTYSEGWWAFPREWIPSVVDLCRRQAQRFRQEAAKIDAQLLSL